jgi:hypothetical protein
MDQHLSMADAMDQHFSRQNYGSIASAMLRQAIPTGAIRQRLTMLGAQETDMPELCKLESQVWVWERCSAQEIWEPYEAEVQRLIEAANARVSSNTTNTINSTHLVHTTIGSFSYQINPKEGTQINVQTGCVRRVRLFSSCSFSSKESVEPEEEPANVKTLTIHIMNLTGDCVELSVRESDTILQVKRAFGKIDGTSHYQQSLWKTESDDPNEEPAPLKNLRTVAQSGLTDGTLLTLLVGDRLGLGAILTDIETFRCEKKLKSMHLRAGVAAAAGEGGGVRRALGMGAAAVERARLIGRVDMERRNERGLQGGPRGGLLDAIRRRAEEVQRMAADVEA